MRSLVWLSGFVLILAWPAYAQTGRSRCADCHLAAGNPPNPNHLADWERSPHGRQDVGCDKCHGGDPTTFEEFLAHKGMLPWSDAKSPINRRNLPATCGSCHPGPYVAFQESQHYALLKSNNENVPSCSTCHHEVGAFLLTPKGLERQCAQCHGPGKIAPRPGRPETGRKLLEDINAARTQLKATRDLLDRVPKGERRTQLEAAYEQANVPVVQAVHDAHRFVFDSTVERLGVARQRLEALYSELLNSQPPASRNK